jgi:DNA-binding IscR family transcriptional regulator
VKEKLTTNYYKVLEILYDSLATINNEQVAIITQAEIAERLKLSKITINAIFKELRNDSLVKPHKFLGRYYLSDKAIEIVKNMKKV